MSADSFHTSGNSPGSISIDFARPAVFVTPMPACIPPAVSSPLHIVTGFPSASHVVEFALPNDAEAA